MRDILRGILGQGKDQTKPKEVGGGKTIEVGGSNYLLSAEAMGYIGGGGFSGYEKSKSVLILEEPHENLEAQINLYRFLEVLFKDHPDLISKTVFLAEGYPANKQVDLSPLIEAEPNPSEKLIWEVLSTYLITGYMAYEWKYRRGIPIVGTEDEALHRVSGRVWSRIRDETSPFWKFTVVLRNNSIANVLIDKATEYGNPILFVGGKHLLERLDESDRKGIDGANIDDVFGGDAPDFFVMQGKNRCIHDYLEDRRIGYNFFYFKGVSTEGGIARYRRLFEIQEKGDYGSYIEDLVRDTGFAVTTRPSPEAAAEFVKEYKSKSSGVGDKESGQIDSQAQTENTEAVQANEKGKSLSQQGEYVEAAQEFSAASASDPAVSGYKFSIQESMIKEVKARVIRVIKDPNRKFKLKRGVKSDLPIFGPYIEKDHYEKVTAFAQKFSKIPGVQDVIDNAMSSHWETRFGGALQIKVAEILGVGKVRGFEEKYQAKFQDKGWFMRVDIATKDDIAIECKNFTRNVYSSDVFAWFEQATGRLFADKKGHKYGGVLIVIPDGKDIKIIEDRLESYLSVYNPEFAGKIKICRITEINENLGYFKRR